MRTIPMRVPDETAASVKRVAAAKGEAPGTVLAAAWRWWVSEHQDEIVADLEATIEAIRGTLGGWTW